MNSRNKSRFGASLLIALVFVMNVQAGIDFYFNPGKYTTAFELSGVSGDISVAGVGLLFLMWNVPYAFALWNPIKNKISLVQASLMQFIGVVGETTLLYRFSNQDHPFLASSIKRFVYFDSAGLIFLLLATIIVYRHLNKQRGIESHAV